MGRIPQRRLRAGEALARDRLAGQGVDEIEVDGELGAIAASRTRARRPRNHCRPIFQSAAFDIGGTGGRAHHLGTRQGLEAAAAWRGRA